MGMGYPTNAGPLRMPGRNGKFRGTWQSYHKVHGLDTCQITIMPVNMGLGDMKVCQLRVIPIIRGSGEAVTVSENIHTCNDGVNMA
eukprot:699417-Lingulodinium_polyedra.AAC.1